MFVVSLVRIISSPAQQLIKISHTRSSNKLPILLRMTSSSVSNLDCGSYRPMAEGARGVKTTPTHSVFKQVAYRFGKGDKESHGLGHLMFWKGRWSVRGTNQARTNMVRVQEPFV